MIEQPDQAREISKYNEGQLAVGRLNNLWLAAEHYARGRNAGDLKRWRYILDGIWRELWADNLLLNKKVDLGKKEVEKKEYNEEYRKWVCNKIDKNTKVLALFYKYVMKYHVFLKEIQFESGRGGKYIEAGGDDME